MEHRLAWWVTEESERCVGCDQGHAWEVGVHCIDCDAPLCPLCAIIVRGNLCCGGCAVARRDQEPS
jgi:hypothetical protein